MPFSGSRRPDGRAQEADAQTPLLRKSLQKSAAVSTKIALLLQDWWLWEILSAITGLVAIIVIIVILVLFDQSSLPDWPSVFTVRSTNILHPNRPLKIGLDKLSHLLLWHNSEAFPHVGYRGLNLAIEMAVVSPG